jgi:acyl-CoA reductase-like NAD-dependent aldehyde dehydrogenase
MNASGVITFDRFFVGGRWVEPSTDERITVIAPHSEEVVGSVPAGVPADVDAAVAAARTAMTGEWESSGLGREMGPEGLNAYLEPQSVLLPPRA